MGIDIYAKWRGQTEEEEKAQYTGFSVWHGHVGYLREAYHGGPYATKVLVPEAFKAEECEAKIPAKVMRKRLPAALAAVEEREKLLYQSKPEDIERSQQSFTAFVDLCAAKEAETGEPCLIRASA